MASTDSSSSSTVIPAATTPTFVLPNFTQPICARLEGPNYIPWLTRIVPVIRSNELLGFIDGTDVCPPEFLSNESAENILNPEHSLWVKKDQILLSWLTATLSEKVLSTIFGLHTSKLVWTALANKFASQSQSRISHIKRELQSLRQGSKTCSDYILEAKNWSDQLAAIGKPIEDDDLINFLISGLNPTYNAFITTFTLISRDKSLSFDDFQNELLSHEMLLNQQQLAAPDVSTFALFTNRPGYRQQYNPRNKQNFNRGPPRGSSQRPNSFSTPPFPSHRSNGFSPQNSTHQNSAQHQFSTAPSSVNSTSNSFNRPVTRPPCQICGKSGHQALDCFHRMDYSYQGRHPPPQLAAMVAQTNTVLEDSWFADSGANAHITNDLATLEIQQPFESNETVAVGNGSNLLIDKSGSTLVHSSDFDSDFQLNNVLHCPQASAKLLSVQRFCADNDCFLG